MTMPANDVVVAHYNEIALKLGHRPMFVAMLMQNIQRALEGLPVAAVKSTAGRIVVGLGDAPEETTLARLVATPGIANLLPAQVCEADIEAIEVVLRELGQFANAHLLNTNAMVSHAGRGS